MTQRAPIIAVVDDDKVFQFTTLKTIQAANLTDSVLQFENGDDALKFLRKYAGDSDQLPDYIFLDINMPVVDGWMFLEDYAVLKNDLEKEITIIMVSSSIDPRDVRRAQNNENVLEYISKPVSKEKLIELVQKAA